MFVPHNPHKASSQSLPPRQTCHHMPSDVSQNGRCAAVPFRSVHVPLRRNIVLSAARMNPPRRAPGLGVSERRPHVASRDPSVESTNTSTNVLPTVRRRGKTSVERLLRDLLGVRLFSGEVSEVFRCLVQVTHRMRDCQVRGCKKRMKELDTVLHEKTCEKDDSGSFVRREFQRSSLSQPRHN